MAKPADDLSDDQLREGIATGEYEGRGALIAGEILQRRHEERVRSAKYRLGAIGAAVASLWLWLTKLQLRKKKAVG
jgi:hypothetical protein